MKRAGSCLMARSLTVEPKTKLGCWKPTPLQSPKDRLGMPLRASRQTQWGGSIDHAEACRKIIDLKGGLPQGDLVDPDLLVIVGVDSDLDEFPLGSVGGHQEPRNSGRLADDVRIGRKLAGVAVHG